MLNDTNARKKSDKTGRHFQLHCAPGNQKSIRLVACTGAALKPLPKECNYWLSLAFYCTVPTHTGWGWRRRLKKGAAAVRLVDNVE